MPNGIVDAGVVVLTFSASANAVFARALPQNLVVGFGFYGKRFAVGVVFNDSPIIGVADAFALASMWRVRMVRCPLFGKGRMGEGGACMGRGRGGVGYVHFRKRTKVISEILEE